MASSLGSIAARPVPGSYGLPGQDKYFESRVEQHGSTVVRINVPPGPLNPRVVPLLDAKSFPVLFDVDKVKKRDVFTGTYMPSASLTGGYRVCAYLDPSEPTHAKLEEGGKSDFNKLNDATSFDFICDAYFGVRPSATDLGAGGPSKAAKWLLLQLAPLPTLGLPMFIEEPFLHTLPLPSILVSGVYKALYKYFSTAASEALDAAESLDLSREEACHNLLFATVFNSYGGFKKLFPGILADVSKAGEKLHQRLAAEIRTAVAEAGGEVTVAALEKMELTNSVVREALRLDPPVKFQYGRAKEEMQIESHDAVYVVNKGEMLFGYQPCATKDARVFGSTAGQFVGDRFVGDEGSKLLQYVCTGPTAARPRHPASGTSSARARTWWYSSGGSSSWSCSSVTTLSLSRLEKIRSVPR
ncbi:hypothetical protein SETIT_9G483800v2 [Setaria italica]|uniref:Allene oxide synthase n=1 Tax=Setaria italica TaxID=4555 RepID=A0A368STR9_SETIT|nr:hypothetical protein SETIT_9G483800v2 [Setaria italica]